MFKKTAVFLLAAILLSVMLGVIASAISSPYYSCALQTNETSDTTAVCSGTYKLFDGFNSNYSLYSVDFISYHAPSGGSWTKDVSVRAIANNINFGTTETTHVSPSQGWYLELNPVGIGKKDCVATGYIWYA